MWSRENTFETLVHIILEQQVSLASALSALNKLRAKITHITPENFLKLNDEELKACYFSRQKTIYVRGLAEVLHTGSLNLVMLETLSNDEIRSLLIKINGFGHWTIDIYLIFVLKRMDIFPSGDLAAVKALKRIKKLPTDAPKEKVLRISARWSPYRTIATMILWHYYLSADRKS